MPATPQERRLAAQIAQNIRWANEPDRAAATAPARAALNQKFLDQAGGDPVRAENLRKAHFQRLALKSAQARRRAKEALAVVEECQSQLEAVAAGSGAHDDAAA